MPIGIVKWFNDEKGYGFIKQEGVAEDIFVHHTAIKMEGHRTLQSDEKVQFDIEVGAKGRKAVNVVRIIVAEPAPNKQKS